MKLAQVALALLVLVDLYQHYKAAHKTEVLPEPIVVVTKPLALKMTDYITQTGNIVAFNSVSLVARVAGYLDAIKFVDGTFVKKNDNLFIIEPEPYIAKLREAKASVAAQKAIYAYDKTEYERQKRMYKENATSLNNVEKWLAKSEQSAAEVDKAVANEEIAAINYSYTHVDAPFDGRIGRHLIDIHNLVGNGAATTLATIDQLDPIYIYFNLNELDFIKLRDAARAHGYSEKIIKQIPVAVSLQGDSGYFYKGKLDFMNTGLNASTGTMEFRALLPNKEHALLPGLFVQIRIAISDPAMRLTVPDTAVQYDQIGAYLLLVDKTNTVVLQRVKLGSNEQGNQAIIKGLNASDKVILSGLQNATPGHKVVPQDATPEVTKAPVENKSTPNTKAIVPLNGTKKI